MSGDRTASRALAGLVVVVDYMHAAEIEEELRWLGLKDLALSRMVSGWEAIGSGYLIAVARPYSSLLSVYCASKALQLHFAGKWRVP